MAKRVFKWKKAFRAAATVGLGGAAIALAANKLSPSSRMQPKEPKPRTAISATYEFNQQARRRPPASKRVSVSRPVKPTTKPANYPVARTPRPAHLEFDYRLYQGEPGLSAATINEILRDSPLAGKGDYILRQCRQFNIDPAPLLAHFEVEANFGRLGVAAQNKNPGNIRSIKGGFVKYAGWEAGIRGFCWQLSHGNHYFRHGRTTAEQIIPVYAPPTENKTGEYLDAVKKNIRRYRKLETESGS